MSSLSKPLSLSLQRTLIISALSLQAGDIARLCWLHRLGPLLRRFLLHFRTYLSFLLVRKQNKIALNTLTWMKRMIYSCTKFKEYEITNTKVIEWCSPKSYYIHLYNTSLMLYIEIIQKNYIIKVWEKLNYKSDILKAKYLIVEIWNPQGKILHGRNKVFHNISIERSELKNLVET